MLVQDPRLSCNVHRYAEYKELRLMMNKVGKGEKQYPKSIKESKIQKIQSQSKREIESPEHGHRTHSRETQ